MDILEVKEENFNDALAEISDDFHSKKEGFMLLLVDIFTMMPHKCNILSRLVSDISKQHNIQKEVIDIMKTVIRSKDVEHIIVLIYYMKTLNIKTDIDLSKIQVLNVIENSGFEEFIINVNDCFVDMESKDEVLKSNGLELMIEQHISSIVSLLISINEDMKDFILQNAMDIALCCIIIKNYSFSPVRCIESLDSYGSCDFVKDYFQIYLYSLIYLVKKEQCELIFIIALLIRLIRSREDVNTLLENLKFFTPSSRNLIITFLYENFLNKKPGLGDTYYIPFSIEDEVHTLKEYIDEDTVKVMRRYCNIEKLSKFLPEYSHLLVRNDIKPLKKEHFKITDDKIAFFRDFCLLGYPSISHFLSYLEIYKKHFILNEEEQKQLLAIFIEINEDRDSYREIIIGKMIKFGIIDQKLV